MKWYKFWSKPRKQGPKSSFEVELLDMDFFCQLTYMAAIATSGISRSGLFYHASKLPYISARYFKKAEFVAKMFNHDYSSACRIVGEKTKEPGIKALLLRLSGALSSGEDVATFLERESEIFAESYGSKYEQRMEVLKKWSDAYVALIMTSALVTVMSVVSMMIGSITVAFIMTLSSLTILITIFGAWFIYKTAPRETTVHSLPYRSKEQTLAKSVAVITLPAGGIIILSLLVVQVSLGWILLTASVCLFPLGFISMIDDWKIGKRDAEIAGFLRSLGGVSQAIGATSTEAMGRLDLRSLGILRKDAELLYTRLLAGIDPDLCWQRFIGETGSEQINRSVRIFWDGVNIGGEPQRVGNEASSFATKISLLRAVRGLTASGFTWLVIVMHAVLTALSIFIFEVLRSFSALIQTIMPGEDTAGVASDMPSVGTFDGTLPHLDLLHFMIIAIVIVLTLSNAFAIYALGGGHLYKLAFYMAITLGISGVVILLVPSIVEMMFVIVEQ